MVRLWIGSTGVMKIVEIKVISHAHDFNTNGRTNMN